MGVLSGLERRLQGAVDKTFARIFGGAVQPAEVTAALQREAASHLTRHDSRVIAPNRYIVELGPSDSAEVGSDIRRVNSAFSAMLATHVRDQGWDTFADVAVSFEESQRLHTGQFRVSSLIDPSIRPIYDVPHAGSAPRRLEGARRTGDRGSVRFPAARPAAAPHPSGRYPAAPGAAGVNPAASYPASYPASVHPAAPSYPQNPAPHDPAPQNSAPHAATPPNQPSPYARPEPPAPYGDPYPTPYPVQSAPRLLVQDGTGRSHLLRRGSNIVGRGQDAALRLADTSVSRQHIDVYYDGQVAIVHDLGSTNGTAVNGAPVQTWQLADGDVIRIGQSTVVFAGR